MTAGDARLRTVPAIRDALRMLCSNPLQVPATPAAEDLAARHERAVDALCRRLEALLADLARLDRCADGAPPR